MRRPAATVLVLVFGLAVLAGVWIWKQTRLEHRQDRVIKAAAARYQVDPALIKAVVWRESLFNPEARGGAGEIGLMQLQEIAAQEWADAEQIRPFRHEQCLDPRTNTLAGTYYLAKLLRRYQHTDNPVAYALADYNAGRTNVRKWLQGEAETNSAMFLENIAFPMTRDYVAAVMKRTQHYRR